MSVAVTAEARTGGHLSTRTSTVLTLVSHPLCPYVQRVAIALAEKGVPFERRWVDLADKPDWFRHLSPLGKVPLLMVGPQAEAPGAMGAVAAQGEPIVLFESAAILEYLDDVHAPPLHPADPIERARQRAWMEFGSQVLNAIARLYNAPATDALNAEADRICAMFDRIEDDLCRRAPAWTGPWFAGGCFSLVDAVFGPVFRYFDTFEAVADLRLLGGRPYVSTWRAALADRPSVANAIDRGYPDRLARFLRGKGTAISARVRA